MTAGRAVVISELHGNYVGIIRCMETLYHAVADDRVVTVSDVKFKTRQHLPLSVTRATGETRPADK